jgi:hypothetical protein
LHVHTMETMNMNGAELHILLNHIPVLGTAFAALLILAGILRGSDELKKAGLWAFVVSGVAALGASLTGEGAERVVEGLPGVTKAVIHEHEEAAEKALVGSLALGALAFAALAHAFKTGRLHAKAAALVLALSLPAMGILAYAAHLGGMIRHTELRK